MFLFQVWVKKHLFLMCKSRSWIFSCICVRNGCSKNAFSFVWQAGQPSALSGKTSDARNNEETVEIDSFVTVMVWYTTACTLLLSASFHGLTWVRVTRFVKSKTCLVQFPTTTLIWAWWNCDRMLKQTRRKTPFFGAMHGVIVSTSAFLDCHQR